MQVTNNQYVNNYTALLIAKAIPEILFGLGIFKPSLMEIYMIE